MSHSGRSHTKDDPTWESVLEALSAGGHLARFYRVPRHELSAMMKLYGRKALVVLGRVFALTQSGDFAARQNLLDSLTEHHRYVALCWMVRSMKCWVETESFVPNGVRGSWKVANS